MATKKNITFNPNDISELLANLNIKRSYLGNPASIYYVGYSNPVISKAFRTGEIDPVLLENVKKLIAYLSNPKLKRPTLLSFIEIQEKNEVLNKRLESIENQKDDRVETLTSIIQQVSNDLFTYSEQFQRASNFLDYSIKKQ